MAWSVEIIGSRDLVFGAALETSLLVTHYRCCFGKGQAVLSARVLIGRTVIPTELLALFYGVEVVFLELYHEIRIFKLTLS